MKELEINIRKNGFDYVQTMKSEYGYIYAQMSEGKVVAYEVFKRKENTYFNCISFPGNDAFGLWAWTKRTLPEALKKLESFKVAYEKWQEELKQASAERDNPLINAARGRDESGINEDELREEAA